MSEYVKSLFRFFTLGIGILFLIIGFGGLFKAGPLRFLPKGAQAAVGGFS